MSPGDRLTLRIEKAVAGGRMLARHDGAIVLVAGAIPGEVVEAIVEKVQRSTGWAATSQVIERSPDRVDAVDGSCGGSVYSHVRYDRQLDLKREVLRDAFSRLGHITLDEDIPVSASPIDGYRMRARLHLRGGALGFFREGTHEICDAGATRQLRGDTLHAVRALADALRGATDAPLEIDVSENRAADERACHVELPANADPSRIGSISPIDGIRGVSLGHTSSGRTHTLWGTPVVTDVLAARRADGATAQVTLARHARAFFQGNRFLLDDLVSAVGDAVPPGAVIDLYAGVGLFAVTVAAKGNRRVIAVEGDRVSAGDLKQNAAPYGDAVTARHQPVEVFLATHHAARGDTTVIVDPPRTGMTKDALRGAMSLRAARMVYVSCDVATLARDSRLLIDGGYRLSSLRAFDLFPNTAHVESLAVFDRR